MLRSIKDLMSYPIEAKDGSLGKARDALFDDRFWTLRYLVADTRKWLPGKKVLVSPLHLRQPDIGMPKHSFPVELTKEQVKACPELDEDAPVSRQYEKEFTRYYSQDMYWSGPYAFGSSATPLYGSPSPNATTPEEVERHAKTMRKIDECHLRSVNEVLGYHIDARDDEFGYVEDFIMEDKTWRFRFVVVDSRKWLPGKKFLIDTDWLKDIDWQESRASVELTREQIESAPVFNPHEPVNQDYLHNLYDYYGRPHPENEPMIPVQPI